MLCDLLPRSVLLGDLHYSNPILAEERERRSTWQLQTVSERFMSASSSSDLDMSMRDSVEEI